MPLDTEVGLLPGHVALDGDPATLPEKNGHSPHQFLAHVCCGQIKKMPFGKEVGFGPGGIVLARPCSFES